MSRARTMTVVLDARRYEDEDDCLESAADDVRRSLGLRGWDLSPRFDANRDTIALTVPRPGEGDAAGWDRLRNLDCLSCTEA